MKTIKATITGTTLIILAFGLALPCKLAGENLPEHPHGQPTPSESSFEKLRAQATAARERDQVPEALRLYQKLVALRPNWTEGWWFFGVLNYDKSHYEPAARAFEQFVKLEPANGQGWGMLGLCESKLQRIGPALRHLTKAFELKCGGNEEMIRVVRYHQALLLIRLKEFEPALGLLSAFAVEHRESNSILDAMGMAILRLTQPLESFSAEKRTMIREFGRGGFLEAEQKMDDAGRLFEQLEAKYRGEANVAYAYGIDLQLRHQYELAEQYFKKELERDPNHVAALLQLANYCLMTGALDDGMQYAKKAIELAPMNGIGYYFLGRVHLRRDELPQALVMFEKSAKLEPQAPNVQYSLSQVYTRLNQPQAAARARAEYDRLEAILKQQTGMVFDPKGSGGIPSDVSNKP